MIFVMEFQSEKKNIPANIGKNEPFVSASVSQSKLKKREKRWKNNINIRRVLLAHSQLLEYPYICSGDTKHKNIEKKNALKEHTKREK